MSMCDIALTVEGKELSYDEATGLYSVVDKACTNGAHSYTLAEVYETAERDCVAGGIYYYRCECGAYVTGYLEKLGHSYTIITIEKEATATELGIKRADCDRCDDYYTFEYAFSPAEIEVTITVNTINGQKDITLLASDVFDFVITEGANYSCVINAIKDGDGYTKQDIVKLTIPSGLITVASEAISGLTSLKEIETMNYANVIFNKSAFKDCLALEKLTLGNGDCVFNGEAVSNCPNFAVIDMTNANVTFNENAFNNRKNDYHVFIYTVQATLPNTINNCNRVIYQGIGHAYTSDTITPSTCVTPSIAGYVTDCPCGIDYRESAYTSYSSYDSSLDNVAHQPFGLETVELPLSTEHTLSDVVKSINYKDGFFKPGTKTFKCLYCDEISGTEETASFPVIFSFNGYSVPENGELAITVGYSVDLEVLEEYEAVMGKLEFGVVAAVAERLNGKAPLDEANKSVIKAQIDGKYASFDLVIKGFNETQLDLALIMCAYVYDGTKYVYLQDMQVDSPVPVSINSVMNRK